MRAHRWSAQTNKSNQAQFYTKIIFFVGHLINGHLLLFALNSLGFLISKKWKKALILWMTNIEHAKQWRRWGLFWGGKQGKI